MDKRNRILIGLLVILSAVQVLDMILLEDKVLMLEDRVLHLEANSIMRKGSEKHLVLLD